MAIVKRKNVSGGTYYFNTTTKKFASEAAYKRSKSAPLAKHKARSGGRPSENVCTIYGRELKVKHTSAAGRGLRKCR